MAIVVGDPGKRQCGGYDAWGVRLPSGLVREFTTQAKAEMYKAAMEGKDVLQGDGDVVKMTGLAVVHRFIPTWTEIPDDTEADDDPA